MGGKIMGAHVFLMLIAIAIIILIMGGKL